jgi:hypothetical protein
MDAYYRPRTAPAEELLGAGLPGALRKKKEGAGCDDRGVRAEGRGEAVA